MRRFADKIIYEISLPGVESTDDISVVRLENSIELRAIAKKKAAADESTAAAFIEAAPDGKKTIKTAGRKSIISVSIAPEMLAKVDAWAKARGIYSNI